jgi:hypothetical protein
VRKIDRPAHPIDADYFEKHTPGGHDHDQSTHGRGGGSATAEKPAELKGFPARDSVRDERGKIEASEKWKKSITPDEQNVINDYTNNAFESINKTLRGERKDPEAMKKAKTLSAVIDRAGEGPERIVYRGIHSGVGLANVPETSEDVVKFRALMQSFEDNVGKTIRMTGFQSTSPDSRTAVAFSGKRDLFPKFLAKDTEAVFEIKTRRGAPIGALSGQRTGEKEFLLGHNWRYKVPEVIPRAQFKDPEGRTRYRRVIRLEVV